MNTRRFGVCQEDYTTKLDKGKLTKEQQRKAEQIAAEIERSGRGRADEAEVCACVCTLWIHKYTCIHTFVCICVYMHKYIFVYMRI